MWISSSRRVIGSDRSYDDHVTCDCADTNCHWQEVPASPSSRWYLGITFRCHFFVSYPHLSQFPGAVTNDGTSLRLPVVWRSYLPTVAVLFTNGNNASIPRILLNRHIWSVSLTNQPHPQSFHFGAGNSVTPNIVSGFLSCCQADSWFCQANSLVLSEWCWF
jgi:hypothetical protein